MKKTWLGCSALLAILLGLVACSQPAIPPTSSSLPAVTYPLTGTPTVAPPTVVAPHITGPATVRIDPLQMTIVPSQPFSLPIHIDNVANLVGFEIHLSFDPAILEVEKVSSGMVSVDFIAQNEFDNKLGTIDYAVVQINKPAVSGSGTLLIINFIAKAGGTSPISYRTNYPAAPAGVLLADANGLAIPATLQPGSVTVATPTRVPGN